MNFLKRLMPGHRQDEETARLMREYHENREAALERREACHSFVQDKLDATQEIMLRIEARPQSGDHFADSSR